MQGHR